MLTFLVSAASAQGLLEPHRADIDPPDAIIHGDRATEDDWPMAGALIVGGLASYEGIGPTELRSLNCSCTLIAPDVVLVAAHCVSAEILAYGAEDDDFALESYEVADLAFSRQEDLSGLERGDPDEELADWPDDAVFATSWVAHPDFDPYALQYGLGQNDDIALVFLEEPLAGVAPAVLPTAEEAEQLEVGVEVEIVGWGEQADDSDEGEFGEKRMATSVVAALGPFEMQIGERASDPRKCHGDSGGPTFLRVESDSPRPWRLVGVTSHAWDEAPCEDAGSVDTRVDPHLAWIDERMRAACDEGIRSWCAEPGILRGPAARDAAMGRAGLGGALVEEPVACGCRGVPAAPWLAVGVAALALGPRRRAMTRGS